METKQNTVARTLHDLGLAAWFGGTLMGAVGLNGATRDLHDPRERTRATNAGWARWQPVNAVAVGAHLVGSGVLTYGNKSRIGAQQGVGTVAAVKTAVTAAAVAVSAYSGVLGRRIMRAEEEAAGFDVEDATTPAPQTPPEAEAAQRQQRLLQWVVPALTGTLLVLNAKMGEQQRPLSVARGLLKRVR